MPYKTDKLADKIARGETIYGTHTAWGGAMIAEMYGEAGFDVVWIDNEHGYMDPSQVLNALVGARARDMCAFVRVTWRDGNLAKPILDNGVDGIIFPMILTPDDARKAVAACRYPPAGERGFGPFRAMDYGAISAEDYIAVHSQKVWVILQIEHIEAVRNLDAILRVPGISAIVFGPCDLSGSMGLLGQVNHPEVKKVIDGAVDKIKAAKIPVGVSMIWNEEAVHDWVRRGANIIFCDNDCGHVITGSRKTLAKLKKAAAEK
ncbi:MAG: 4-hydroxy-3-methylbut-2-en-1-yl diphosphate synthase [Planctomycetota bacterium]|jgi:2-keto-3-deoxy-L-rhamnonate aldolase RhmA|nr:4-hydroxy-3-methylbut-2-en-1-yl diphosphate synthase [Planctomycetota bacterium]